MENTLNELVEAVYSNAKEKGFHEVYGFAPYIQCRLIRLDGAQATIETLDDLMIDDYAAIMSTMDAALKPLNL